MKTLAPRLKPLKMNSVGISPTKRITGNALYALMKRFERENPRLCAECARQGTVGYGDELDHIIPLHLGGSNAPYNLQWLCHSHHLEKSKAETEARSIG